MGAKQKLPKPPLVVVHQCEIHFVAYVCTKCRYNMSLVPKVTYHLAFIRLEVGRQQH